MDTARLIRWLLLGACTALIAGLYSPGARGELANSGNAETKRLSAQCHAGKSEDCTTLGDIYRLADGIRQDLNKAAIAYPWKETYKAFPGPNSNTFTAWIAKQVPKLELKLPFSAIGRGYME